MIKKNENALSTATWFGLNKPEADVTEADTVIFGIPYDGGVSYRGGAAQAPDLLRANTDHATPCTERLDFFSPKVDGVKLSCIQFFVAGILSCILAPILDPAMGFTLPGVSDIFSEWFNILYAGVMSCGVAYTFQVVAQADVEPTLASMILCLESVFAVLAGAALLGEAMGAREIIGCALMFVAILVAQLPSKEDTGNITTAASERRTAQHR